jgi:predicted aconitase
VVVDATAVPEELRRRDVFFPVLGTWLGLEVGQEVSVIEGLPEDVTDDQLKALGAAAASTGAVALFHVAGVTPEADTVDAALQGTAPRARIEITSRGLRASLDRLSTTRSESVDAVAVGSPHFSRDEFAELVRLIGGKRARVPFFACTSRDVLESLEASGDAARLGEAGVDIVVDTCVVVTPILPAKEGVLMTCSGKFAHYGPSNTGYEVVYGSLEDCVASAVSGTVTRDVGVWAW